MQRKTRDENPYWFFRCKVTALFAIFHCEMKPRLFSKFHKALFLLHILFSIVYHLYFFMAFCMYSLGEQP